MGSVLYFIGLFLTLFIVVSLIVMLFETLTELKLESKISANIRAYIFFLLIVDLFFTILKQIYNFNLLYVLGSLYQYIIIGLIIFVVLVIVISNIFIKN